MRRGELYRVRHPRGDPKRSRVFVIVGRQSVIDSSFSTVICAPIVSNQHGLSTQVEVGVEEGLKHPSAIACDGLMSIPKAALTDYVGRLRPSGVEALDQALSVAVGLQEVAG